MHGLCVPHSKQLEGKSWAAHRCVVFMYLQFKKGVLVWWMTSKTHLKQLNFARVCKHPQLGQITIGMAS